MLEVVAERLQVVLGREVLLLAGPPRDRVDHATDELLDGALALRRANLPAEVLRDDDVRGLLRPEAGELDVALLEDQLAALVGDDGRPQIPFDFVEWIDAVLGEEPLVLEAGHRPAGAKCPLGCLSRGFRLVNLHACLPLSYTAALSPRSRLL